MGYAMMIGECGQCHRVFSFNPVKVPSLNNIPFCKECVDCVNPIREEKGLPVIRYSEDAYSYCEENELS